MTKNDTYRLEFLKNLGKRIAALRKERNMTQPDLGYAIEMEKQNVNRIEKGQTNPTATTMLNICIALNITMSELLEGVDRPRI